MRYGLMCLTIPIGLIFCGLGILFYRERLEINILPIELRRNGLSANEIKRRKKIYKLFGIGFILVALLIAISPLIVPEEMIIQ